MVNYDTVSTCRATRVLGGVAFLLWLLSVSFGIHGESTSLMSFGQDDAAEAPYNQIEDPEASALIPQLAKAAVHLSVDSLARASKRFCLTLDEASRGAGRDEEQ